MKFLNTGSIGKSIILIDTIISTHTHVIYINNITYICEVCSILIYYYLINRILTISPVYRLSSGAVGRESYYIKVGLRDAHCDGERSRH